MTTPKRSRPKRILVPVDLSERSEIAVEYAATLAGGLGSSLALITNLNLPERAALEQFAKAEGTTVQKAAHLQLERLARELSPEVETSTVVTEKEYPADGILEACAQTGADLVVIASHGRAGMTRWLLGSVAEKIVRVSDVPVVVVPARDQSSTKG